MKDLRSGYNAIQLEAYKPRETKVVCFYICFILHHYDKKWY